jgi:PAS domain S-box-containing protein
MSIVELLSICVAILSLMYCWQAASRSRANQMTLNQQRLRERLVDRIAQQIRQSLNLDEVLATTVTEVQGFLNVDRVLIYRVWEDGTGCVIHETALPPYTRILGQSFPEEVFPQEYHQAYLHGKTRTIANVDREDVEACLADFVKQFGVQAKLVVPIIQQQRDRAGVPPIPYLWGLLIAHQCSHPRQWIGWEVDLMQQLATQVAIAIQQSEFYQQLQQLNAQLELRVRHRTEELAQTNVSLRHTNDTLQALIAASPRAIIRLDLAGNVKIWNPAAEQMFGWTAAEVIDRPNPITLEHPDRLIHLHNFPPNAAAQAALDYPNLLTSILQGQTYSRLELSQQQKDGTPIDIIFSAAPLPNPDGRIGGIVAVIADVTEQKQRAEELRLLQSVVVNTNDAAIVTEAEPIDAPGPRILYVNEAFTRITGYQPAEVLGQSPRILQGAKTDRAELLKVRQALQRWEPITVEVINYRKDGSEFWNEFSLVPVGDKNGHYTHWISVQRDTTGRKLAEQALRHSEERFRSLIENALDIIMILDLAGNITYVSPSVAKVLGYPAIVLVGKNMLDFIHPEDRQATHARFAAPSHHSELTDSIGVAKVSDSQVSRSWQSDRTDGKPFEFRHCHQDGSWRILEAIGQPFVDSAAIRRVMVNARDITERKRLDEIRLALEREKELNTLKTRFFSMASHEFRTPLSTALAAAQVLENSQTEWENTSKRLRNLHRIQDSVRNVVQLLDDILTINRAETGKLAFNPNSLDLEDFCHQFVEEMQFNSGSHYAISFNCIGTAMPIAVDEKLIRSIVANLLSNAIKYSPQGGEVSLTLEFERDKVAIEVRDRGIGIAPADLQQLFEPFYRGKNVRIIPGTGLGLVVVKKCVDLHQGSIEIVSEVNVGTTCLVTLPLSTLDSKSLS